MSRAYTEEEARDQFLDRIRHLTRYWAKQPNQSPLERCEGLAFSVLNIIDGTSGGFRCTLDIMLNPHPDDKQFQINVRAGAG
jgi:hypothetical protein